MKKEELFNNDFLKHFKTGDELSGFLKELQKRGIEATRTLRYNPIPGEYKGCVPYANGDKAWF